MQIVERGARAILESYGRETVKAVLPTDGQSGVVNLYWQGHVHFRGLFSFFVENIPPNDNQAFSMLIFTPEERYSIGNIINAAELREKIPPNASFVRLEQGRPAENMGVSPDFIVWSRVDREIFVDTDFMGVSGHADWLKLISGRMAEFVSRTQLRDLPLPSALDLESLLDQIRQS